MDRVFNFSAGPSMMPLPVLERAQRELVNYPGAGCSVMEMSHRSRPFEEILERTEQTLRRLMNIGDDYAVLFLQGGASLQFSMIPMNLAKRGERVDYAVTGQFAQKAFEEAGRWADAVCVATGKESNFSTLPAVGLKQLSPNARYLHITANNTIFGTAWNTLPETGAIPLVADISSSVLGVSYDVSRFGLLYAGAQKNMGPSGLTVVIVRRDLIPESLDPIVPAMLSYKTMAEADSMYNTPPCYAIYMAGLVYEWVEQTGGVAEMERRNAEKAAMLYDTLDASRLFTATANKADRSIMNVTFTLPDKEQTERFLAMAEGRGMVSLKGHRVVGGCRASIYNAMPREGVEALCRCIVDFEAGRRD